MNHRDAARHLSSAIVLVLLLVLAAGSTDSGGSGTRNVPESPSQPALPAAPGSQWMYFQSEDQMGKGTTYSATVQSSNTVTFDFPYSGAQHATLTLRTHPRYGKDIILRIERGQFLCGSYDGCDVLVRFDDGDALTFSAAEPSDNSTEVLFIRDYSRFVGRMLKAERVRISASVYQEGSPVFEFDVRGFSVARYRPAS